MSKTESKGETSNAVVEISADRDRGNSALGAACILAYDLYQLTKPRREEDPTPRPLRWRPALKAGLLALPPVLLGLSIIVIPSGVAGVRVSQISGARPQSSTPVCTPCCPWWNESNSTTPETWSTRP